MSAVDIHLVVRDVEEATAWYAEVLGAGVSRRISLADGTVLAIELRLGETVVAVAGAMPGLSVPAEQAGSAAAYHVHVEDAEAVLERAVRLGAEVFEPLHDAVWGERTAQFLDPSGHRWAVDQHLRDVDDAELTRELTRLFAAG